MPEIEMPDDVAIERMARAIAANFVRDRAGKEPLDHPAMRPWDELDPTLRAQNLQQARDNVVKLARIGLRVVPTSSGGNAAVAFTQDQVEELAQLEHDRWSRQKQEQGYSYGRKRDDEEPDRRHPNLVPWEQLSEDDRDKDREPVQRMIEVLTVADLTVVPVDG